MRKLEQENLLQVKPGIGMVISNVDIELLQQELEIRKMLENYSIQIACEGITEEELKNWNGQRINCNRQLVVMTE
ncbi:hypothetical protein [Peribacillus simplex]|uniref:hypothetical protein n=1 Tax=Peribacillus simplex TaxID=1478 RepID=UPI001E47AF43